MRHRARRSHPAAYPRLEELTPPLRARVRAFMIMARIQSYLHKTGHDHETGGGEGVASMPASARWAGVMGVGAPVRGSRPEAALGKAITSRIVGAPASSMHTRSQPHAMPPCGGGPYLNASSRKPNCDRASVADSPITSNTEIYALPGPTLGL